MAEESQNIFINMSSQQIHSIALMDAIRSSETSVHTRTTRRYIPENGVLL
jgi:hypothetical protein